MKSCNELFTVDYAIRWDNWIKLDEIEDIRLRDTYQWGKYKVYTYVPDFYLLVRIVDDKGKTVYYDYIRTISQYNYIKKKLKLNKPIC